MATQTQTVVNAASAIASAKPYEKMTEHVKDCGCNKKTVDYLNKILATGFLELACPYDSDHAVIVPKGLDSTDEAERDAALRRYRALETKFDDAGLAKNADAVIECIQEYTEHGLDGNIYFHPNTSEVPVGLLTKKQKEAHYDKVAKAAQAKVKEFIPTLPKQALITVLTSDAEVEDGVLGTVFIKEDGNVASMNEIKGADPAKYLEFLLWHGLYMSEFGTGVDAVAVVKTADIVKYFRLFDQRIFELEEQVGKKFALDFLKYRGKSFSKILADGSYIKLPTNRKAFYVAYIDKNEFVPGFSRKQTEN